MRERVPYLRELGITYLHLMPVLATREGADDGGYAVVDYDRVRPELGTITDLEQLASTLHEHGIALTLDLVLNHVAREHPWARAARAGDEPLPQLLPPLPRPRAARCLRANAARGVPDFAPGNFSWDVDAAAWVWTTFNHWQWDLRWSNPDVFCDLLDVVLRLANRGVDCLRLDAIAFLWKRMGTSCQNQPEVHAITQALRAAARIVAPSLLFKAEAIVGPEDVGAYLGRGRFAGLVSDLAYDNTLMVHVWSALATRDAACSCATGRGARPSRRRRRGRPTCAATTTSAGPSTTTTRRPSAGRPRPIAASSPTSTPAASPARSPAAWAFQVNEATGDARVCGTAASLAGLERALHEHDEAALDLALARLFCAHAIVFGVGGVPLLYMGDELGVLNDYGYVAVPEHADDARWMHRPAMPWDLARHRHDPTTLAGRVFAGVRHLAHVRASLPSLHAAVEPTLHETGNPAVFAAARQHPAGMVVALYNVGEHWQRVPADTIRRHGLRTPYDALSSRRTVSADATEVALPPYAAWWLVEGD